MRTAVLYVLNLSCLFLHDIAFTCACPMQVVTSLDICTIHSAAVQQAFLPKFENEGQDSSIADAIVSSADQRYMVVTIKHSGSLVTLSANGFASKNSIQNEFTAGEVEQLHGSCLHHGLENVCNMSSRTCVEHVKVEHVCNMSVGTWQLEHAGTCQLQH